MARRKGQPKLAQDLSVPDIYDVSWRYSDIPDSDPGSARGGDLVITDWQQLQHEIPELFSDIEPV